MVPGIVLRYGSAHGVVGPGAGGRKKEERVERTPGTVSDMLGARTKCVEGGKVEKGEKYGRTEGLNRALG